ncbi:MAG: CoA transferase, partial [Actinomycetota bacterium]|nr:CoA transferase [Actinomycetota bacterium]
MSQPLSGRRVVDMSGLSGAYGTRILASLGAEVIKVEHPGGSRLRRLGPFAEGAPDGEASLWWGFLAMGSKSVVIDPESPDGAQRLKNLLATADVVFDDHGPDVLADAGLGYDDVAATNPGVIWVSITPFGLTGPKRNWSTSNLVAWAASGVLYTVGFADQAPVAPGGPIQMAMHATALNAIAGALMALRARRASGRGQFVDVSVLEAALAIAPETGVPVFLDDRVHRERTGNRRVLSRPFGLYPCADGYVSILVLMPHHWTA